jgi:peptide/nickel transport system ATP-binding protein
MNTNVKCAQAGSVTLHVSGLSVSFGTAENSLHAVRDVSFDIEKGQALGLIGESGSGKSTVAYSVMRYVPGDLSADKIAFRGQDIMSMSADELRQVRGGRIAMVYQDPMNSLNPVFKVGKQVAEVLRHHRGLRGAEADKRVIELFEQVRLPDAAAVARRYPHQLSGGQQQRVVIAMALACKPELLIMDEPTTGLDVTTETVILDLIAELRKELQVAVLFISHNLSVVAKVCDKVAVLYAGQIVEQGAVDEVMTRPRHPYTIGLLNSMLRTDVRLERMQSIPGSIPDLRHRPVGCVFRPRCTFAADVCSEMPLLLPVTGAHLTRCHFSQSIGDKKQRPVEIGASKTSSVAEVAAEHPRLTIRNISKTFATPLLSRLLSGVQPTKAVAGVSISIEAGKTLAVVGESGSGKSTLARCVAGLLAPTEGQILLDGQTLKDAVQRRSRAQQQAVQFIFQNPDSSLNQHHTVAEILSRPLRLFGGKGSGTVDQQVLELLDTVKLGERYAQRYPRELSGGEKQRICIARAFAAKPTVIICDEPTSALDISVQATILNELIALQRAFKMSYLFISHDLAAVRQMADKIAVMYKGKIVEYGEADEIFRKPKNNYTKMLLKSASHMSSLI